jgi:hypothetical protein
MKKRRVLSTPKDPSEDAKFKKELDRCLSVCEVQPQTFAWNPDIPLNPSKLHDWALSFRTDQEETFWKLYVRYKIPPGELMVQMIRLKVMRLTSEDYLEDGWLSPNAGDDIIRQLEGMPTEFTRAKLRSRKKREADARVLEKAAGCLNKWKPVLNERVQSDYLVEKLNERPTDDIRKLAHEARHRELKCPDPNELLAIARLLRELGPSEKHRPEEAELKMSARTLAEFFIKRTHKPLYEYIGILLKAGFPEKWNPASNLKDAARKLVKSAL